MRVLRILAAVRPQGVVTGGAALVGFYLQHRTTRDLDLFWHGRQHLGDVSRMVEDLLVGESLTVEPVQTSSSFRRLRVSDAAETVILDLVADPTETIEPPRVVDFDGARLVVDAPHEILVNKLCALLGSMELRDLQDVRGLLSANGDLARAVADAPRKDAGFSALTLAWILKGMRVRTLAEAVGISASDAEALAMFQSDLVDRLLSIGAPE